MKKHTMMTATILMVFATFLTVGCSTTEEAQIFDFLGNWTVTTTFSGHVENNPMTLTGSLTNGIATMPGMTSGTYTSANNQINITFNLVGLEYYFTGTVTSASFMSGTFTTNLIPGTGTWQAVR